MATDVVTLGPRRIAVWPPGQKLRPLDVSIRWTTFGDIGEYHPALIAKVLELEALKWGDDRPESRALGGRKVHHLDQWKCPEADLINARAIALFKQTLGSPQAAIDIRWANVYRAGAYVAPHAHRRSVASVVYCLDPGDPDADDPVSGKLTIVDPRLDACCGEQKGVMTTPLILPQAAGTMLIWPAEVVHCVNPYVGQRPRITLAWNISRQAVAGSATDDDGVPTTATARA